MGLSSRHLPWSWDVYVKSLLFERCKGMEGGSREDGFPGYTLLETLSKGVYQLLFLWKLQSIKVIHRVACPISFCATKTLHKLYGQLLVDVDPDRVHSFLVQCNTKCANAGTSSVILVILYEGGLTPSHLYQWTL